MQSIKVGFSFGLLTLVCILAGLLGVIGIGLVALNHLLPLHAARCCDCADCTCSHCHCTEGNCKCPVAPVVLKPKGKYEPAKSGAFQLPAVNEAATGEIKHQCPNGRCPQYVPAPLPNYVAVSGSLETAARTATNYGATVITIPENGQFKTYATLRNGLVWRSTGLASTYAHVGTSKDQIYQSLQVEMQQGTMINSAPMMPQPRQPSRIVPGDRSTQSRERSQITLFLLPNDPDSEKLKRWFQTDSTLVSWRSGCTYQEFTPDNKLYLTLRTRDGKRMLRDAVPIEKFPAVVITDPDGGHIHAAGQSTVPTDAATFVADVQKGFEFAKQAKETPLASGLIQATGFAWDSYINPSMRLTSQDCPDGKCPLPNNQPFTDDPSRWVPGQKVHDLFAKPKSGVVKDALWGWLEYAIIGIAVVIAIAVVAALVVFGGVTLLVAYLVRRK